MLDELALERGVAREAAGEDDQLLHRPTVSTYNSFADAIVREHGLRIGRDSESAVLSESAAWLLMRKVVFTSDDPRLEERQESPRTLIDAGTAIARDSVDNLVDLDRLASFPDDFGGSSSVLDLRPRERLQGRRGGGIPSVRAGNAGRPRRRL